MSAEERRRAARAARARARNRAAIGEGFWVWEESKLEQPIGESAKGVGLTWLDLT